MKYQIYFYIIFILLFFSNCKESKNINKKIPNNTNTDVRITSAMKNVMWKGELEGKFVFDTISDTSNIYGIGPLAYLKGEILIKDGVPFSSYVTSDSTMQVKKEKNITAPFFVYNKVKDWETIALPNTVNNISDLERFIDSTTKDHKRPFAFKVIGSILKAKIHIQNLPDGTKVSSPKEAHQGQVNYVIQDEDVEIIGFFSTEHKGVFTHHDSYLHMHLITKDETKMGHLDEIIFDEVELYLPKNK